MPLISLLINKLSGRVDVDVDPDLFTLYGNGRVLTLNTFVYAHADSRDLKILAVGDNIEASKSAKKPDLFGPNSVVPPIVGRR